MFLYSLMKKLRTTHIQHKHTAASDMAATAGQPENLGHTDSPLRPNLVQPSMLWHSTAFPASPAHSLGEDHMVGVWVCVEKLEHQLPSRLHFSR